MPGRNHEILPPGTLVASGASTPPLSVSTYGMAMVTLDITAVTGTTPTLDMWLEGTDDVGTTWFAIPYDHQMELNDASPGAADIAGGTNRRNINGTTSATGVKRYAAIYKHLAAGHVRLRWILGGTSPVFTASANLAGK